MQILEVNGLRKVYTTRFGGASVEALRNINFSVENGEYVAIMGESGSGKTTLLNILAGLDKPTSGSVLLDGKDLASIKESDRAAFRRDHLGFVFQEFNLMENMTIAENIFMGYEPVKKGLIDWNKMNQDALKWMEMVEIDAPPTELVENLSTAQKQCVEIAKCLSHNAKIIILDEPTSSLSEREVRTLFKLIAKLKKEGISIIYISHRMEEIFEIGDRVTVFRDGEKIDTLNIKDTTEQKLIQLMIGLSLIHISEPTRP